MILNIDCVRDVLIELEKLPFNTSATIFQLHQNLQSYTEDEIEYTCLKLSEADYIDTVTVNLLGNVSPRIQSVTCMTFSGHQFLENVKNNTVWSKTKSVLAKAGIHTLSACTQVAVNLASSHLSDILAEFLK